MILKNTLLAVLLFTATFLVGQQQNDGHFLVEFDAFTPPTQDLITSFEGHSAEQFLANDVTGVEHYLGDYKGKKVILWFWSIESTKAKEQMSAMTLLQERNSDLKLIAFVKEPKAQVLDYLRASPVDFSVIPNGEVFGEMAYGAELGRPRMFLIDQQGMIKVVLPEEAFVDNTNLLVSLESILGGF